MAQWARVNNEPITVESEVRVYSLDTGAEGYIHVRWNKWRHPELYGVVTKIVKRFFNPDGSEYENPSRVVLDADPQIV